MSAVLLCAVAGGRCCGLKRPRLGPQGLESSNDEVYGKVGQSITAFTGCPVDVHQTRANYHRGQSQVISGMSALPLQSNHAVVSHKHQGEVGA